MRNSLPPSSPRSFRTQSHRSLLYSTMLLLRAASSQYIYHVGCAINLQSIINSGLIPERTKFEQKTDSILSGLWILWTKNTRILTRSTWEHRVQHSTCTKHGRNMKTLCIGFNLSQKKWLKFYQTRSNAIILHETLPACSVPKVVRMETGEVIYEKVYASPRPPPKISLKHDWKRELGSEDAQRPEGEVARQAKAPNQTLIQFIEQGDLL